MNMIIKSIASEVPSFGKSSSASTSTAQVTSDKLAQLRSATSGNSAGNQAFALSISQAAQQAFFSQQQSGPLGGDVKSDALSYGRQQIITQAGVTPLSPANQHRQEPTLMLKI